MCVVKHCRSEDNSKDGKKSQTEAEVTKYQMLIKLIISLSLNCDNASAVYGLRSLSDLNNKIT